MRTGAILGAVLAVVGLSGAAAQAEMPNVPPYQPPIEGPVENSFAAGTMILTDSGFKDIADIRNGDAVISYDADSQRTVTQRVRDVTSRSESAIYEMGIGGKVIQVTRDHPFLTTDGWKRVIETSVGSTVIGFDGAEYVITSCQVRRGSYTVYNFEVDITGSFYVSDLRLLAH